MKKLFNIGTDFIAFDAETLRQELETVLGTEGWYLQTTPARIEFVQTDLNLDVSGVDAVVLAHGSQAGVDARAIIKQAEADERSHLKTDMETLIAETSFSDLEMKVNTIFADLTTAQKSFLLRVFRVVLYLAKQR